MRIYIQQEGFLDNKNFYLILNFMGKNKKINYKRDCPYEISYNIEKKDLFNFYKIEVSIYESGLITTKFKGDFDILLSDVLSKRDFSQKCKIRLEKKGKDIYSTVVIKSELLYENIDLNKVTNNNINIKQSNKPVEILSKPKIEEKLLNNKKEEKKVDVSELKKKIDEINELKNLLNEKEKIIFEVNNKNQKLKEELVKTQGLLLEKDKTIEKEKNQNQILINKIKDLQNILKAQEEESNKNISNYQNIFGTAPKDEKLIKIFDELQLKEKEIKKLNEMKSRFPFELLENEKLMTIIIISGDQKVHYSIICKNTQKFTEIEHKLYQRYNEYLESENYFLANGKKINKYKSLEENNIKNSDIITLYKFDEQE